MQIAVDYDDTYTKDPSFWEKFKALALSHGHSVVCVTKRGESNKGLLSMNGWTVHNTNRVAKADYCKNHYIPIDVWIDDSPRNIFEEG